MKNILCAPDLHGWYTTPGSEQARIDEYNRCVDKMVRTAIAEKCELALFPGDFWVTNRPSPAQVLASLNMLKWFESEGIPCIGIAGNHDVGGPGMPNFVDVLGEAKPSWGITESVAYSFNGIGVMCLPFRKGITNDDDLFKEFLHCMAHAPLDPYVVLMSHYSTDLSMFSGSEFAVGKEPVFRMADIKAQYLSHTSRRIDLVCLGHIHKPGILAEDPLTLHTGALTRRDVGEATDERGFYIVDIESKHTTLHPLPARRFVSVNPLKEQVTRELVDDAYVKISFKCTAEELRTLDMQTMVNTVKECGAFFVIGVYPEVEREERLRSQEINENLSPLQALSTWLSQQTQIDDVFRNTVITTAEGLLKEVA